MCACLTLPQPSPRPCAVAAGPRARRLRHRPAPCARVGPPLGNEGRKTYRACVVPVGRTLARGAVTTLLKAGQAGDETEFLQSAEEIRKLCCLLSASPCVCVNTEQVLAAHAWPIAMVPLGMRELFPCVLFFSQKEKVFSRVLFVLENNSQKKGCIGLGEIGEGVKKYRLVVTKP